MKYLQLYGLQVSADSLLVSLSAVLLCMLRTIEGAMENLAFCKYCASVMGLEYEQLTGNILLLRTKEYTIYRPHLDLNQIVPVAELKLREVDSRNYQQCFEEFMRKVIEYGMLYTCRDFIISTMEKDNG